MNTATTRRIGMAALAFAAVAASVVAGNSAAAAQAGGPTADGVGTSGLHRSWACSPPAGFTWSAVRINTNCAWRFEYYLLDPVNYNLTGVYACNIPSGYTYTASRQGNNCSTSGSSYEYRLAKA
ncbi:hypothetical protein ABZ816_25525 [Actinosynnema sp. NPDC047251]|uniref:Putative secreted protein n=1 Tax=Saccharothrix espanaensis (strain ATCC 51144 / DSM 44229 / JCM 9112 / NBRC 15066 / NRRL 15764) TaxID=1179773 RepID=K0K2G3_SACES|nr:hypothetical protein [Saccharothrix espanaensis]CCH31767.1 putative secreted protein [Saccharothrix espanaensis DSM 44229]